MNVLVDLEHGSNDEHRARPETPFKTIQAALEWLGQNHPGEVKEITLPLAASLKDKP